MDVAQINFTSPYEVKKVGKEFTFEFFTDFGVHYVVDFELSDNLLSYETYQFAITNANNVKSPNDHKLRDTIMSIIYEFFRTNNSTMLYIFIMNYIF